MTPDVNKIISITSGYNITELAQQRYRFFNNKNHQTCIVRQKTANNWSSSWELWHIKVNIELLSFVNEKLWVIEVKYYRSQNFKIKTYQGQKYLKPWLIKVFFTLWFIGAQEDCDKFEISRFELLSSNCINPIHFSCIHTQILRT